MIQLLRLTPPSFPGQNVLDWRIDVDCDARLREHRDGYGNITHMLYVDAPIDHLKVTVTGRVLTEDRAGVVEGLPERSAAAGFPRDNPAHPSGPGASRSRCGAAITSAGRLLDKLHRLTAHDPHQR